MVLTNNTNKLKKKKLLIDQINLLFNSILIYLIKK